MKSAKTQLTAKHWHQVSDFELLIDQSTASTLHNGEVVSVVDESLDALRSVHHITNYMRGLSGDQSDLFESYQDHRRKVQIRETKRSRELQRLMVKDFTAIQEQLPLHEPNPWVREFFRCRDKFLQTRGRFAPFDPKVMAPEEKQVALNELEALLRAVVSNVEFKITEKKWRRRSKRCRARLLQLFKSALNQHSRVLVVRIDLGLSNSELSRFVRTITQHHQPRGRIDRTASRSSRQNASPVDHAADPFEHPITFEDMDAARTRLLRRLRDHFQGSLLGYAWKLEYGIKKGYHYHCVFLFNGAKHRHDIQLGHLIGDFWKNYAPQHRGIFRNCNANRRQYKFPAVGTVRYHESGHWRGLTYIADYLSKPDYYIALKLPAGRRIFGRSEICHQSTRRGPVRLKNADAINGSHDSIGDGGHLRETSENGHPSSSKR